MKTDVSFRGPAAPHSLLATRVAGPRNPISATAWPDAAARTARAVATRPDRASAGAPNPATGMPTVDFSVAPCARGNRECSAALPRNDSSRCGAPWASSQGAHHLHTRFRESVSVQPDRRKKTQGAERRPLSAPCVFSRENQIPAGNELRLLHRLRARPIVSGIVQSLAGQFRGGLPAPARWRPRPRPRRWRPGGRSARRTR
jgi:hypothetical protein